MPKVLGFARSQSPPHPLAQTRAENIRAYLEKDKPSTLVVPFEPHEFGCARSVVGILRGWGFAVVMLLPDRIFVVSRRLSIAQLRDICRDRD